MKKMSKTMQAEFDEMARKLSKARNAESFEAWYAGSEEAYAERVTNARLPEIRQRWAERRRPVYEEALAGIVETGAGYNTLKALERRGCIEILPSVNGSYRVRLLTV